MQEGGTPDECGADTPPGTTDAGTVGTEAVGGGSGHWPPPPPAIQVKTKE